MITMIGETYVGRFGNSIITQLGLKQLIAHNDDEYIMRAVYFAGCVDILMLLRKNLRALMQSSCLCNGISFTLQLEKIYRSMWEKWCKSEVTNRV